MMGVALIATEYNIRNLSKRLKQLQSFINHSFHCRRHSNCFTLVTRQSSSILKVGVAPAVHQRIKEEWAVIIVMNPLPSNFNVL